jgi:high-affinity nickel-transport protein
MSSVAGRRRTLSWSLRGRLSTAEWRRLGLMFGFVALLHVVGFALLFLAAGGHYHLDGAKTFGIGTGTLAYTLGMRHAFDADHIAAIDNTTRKLMSEGKRPLGVGFFFSLGHSSVVAGLAVLLSLGVKALGSQVRDDNSSLHHYTGLIGTSVSGTFLLLIALLNVIVLVSIVKVFIELRRGRYDDDVLERQLNSRGLMRFFAPLTRSIDRSWKMYPLGFLFGLGFDTATEISLLVLAGAGAATGLPWYAVLVLPLLFAAGMSLFDTLDGAFMQAAYQWAFIRPVRKVYYNLTTTGLSVAVALLIGGVELISVLHEKAGLTDPVTTWIAAITLDDIGYLIVALFLLVWAGSVLYWRLGNVEQRWTANLTGGSAAQ